MIPKSTVYAVVVNNKIVKKGSKQSMVKVAKTLRKEMENYIIDYKVEVYNTPSTKVGDYI